MRHPVLAQPNAARTPASHRTKPVVRIGDLEPGRCACKPCGCSQQQPTGSRQVHGSSKKTAAKREIDMILRECIEQATDVDRPMLSVGIKGDDEGRSSQQGELDAGLDRGALSKIDRVAENDRPGLRRNSGRRVGRTVCHNNDLVTGAPNLGNHLGEDFLLVVGGDHDKDVVVGQ